MAVVWHSECLILACKEATHTSITMYTFFVSIYRKPAVKILAKANRQKSKEDGMNKKNRNP